MSNDRVVINAALMHVSSFRWQWGPCTLPTGRPRGRILRGLWHIQERPTLQRTFQDPNPGSVGHPGLYFIFSQFNLSVKGRAVTLHVLVNSQQVFSWMLCYNCCVIFICVIHIYATYYVKWLKEFFLDLFCTYQVKSICYSRVSLILLN